MNGRTIRLVLFVCAALLAACGQVATPFVTQRPPETEAVADVVLEPTTATEAAVETEAVTEVATEAATEIATEAATEAATEVVTVEATEAEPTEAVTEAATEAVAEATAVEEVTGDPVNGQVLFVTGNTSLGAVPCSTCHNVDSELTLVGPGLLNVGERAASRVPGETAYQYLHQSIVDPEAHVVEGFVAGMMPDVFENAFTEEQINDIIAYLMTLQG